MAVELESLKTACYFSKLDNAALRNISPAIFERKLGAGEVVLWEGEQEEVLYFVISGLLKLFATSAAGREFVVRLVYGGDSVNDDVVFDRGPNLLNAMTMTPVMLYGLRRPELESLLRSFPQINSTIAEVLVARQRYFVRLATELVFKNVTGRLARLLLEREELSRAGATGLRITQQEMASMIGTVREIVSRSLRELEAAGAISLRGYQIVITNRRLLEELGNV